MVRVARNDGGSDRLIDKKQAVFGLGAFKQEQIDAFFQVIALGNPTIDQLLEENEIKLVAIKQAAALQLFLPALEATTIPQGTYSGTTPIPEEDLPVVAVRAVLVTHEDVDHNVIYSITRLLFEARNELIQEHTASVLIRQPEFRQDLGFSFHEGAKTYYNQDQPNFLVEYAEPLGLLLSVSVLCASGIWQLRLWLEGRQKNRADFYNLEILKLIEQIHTTEDLEQLEQIRTQLFEIFAKVVVDLDEDRISPESFQSFTFPWEVALNTIRHREVLLRN